MPALQKLSERQRVICLLPSHGISQDRIAKLLDMGLRTVELENEGDADTLGITTKVVALWAAKNHTRISESTIGSSLLTPAVLGEIQKSGILNTFVAQIGRRVCWLGAFVRGRRTESGLREDP